MPLSENLIRARSQTGLDQEAVAAALGVSRAMVSYWEAGSRVPNDRQLVVLARLYRQDVAALIGTELPRPEPDVASMLLRSVNGGDLPDDAHRGVQEFIEFLDVYAALADQATFPVRGMEQSPFVWAAGFDAADDARRKAEEVRSHLRVGLGPIGDIDAVCELLGITVYRTAMGDDLSRTISGAFYHHPEIGFSILVNLSMTPGRRRFTVAHELAHALFHSRSEKYIVSTARKPPHERFADAFAGEFLMPGEGVRRVMEEHGFGPRIDDPAEVVHLQRYFGVSWATALVRLKQANYLTRQRFDEFRGVRPVVLARSLGFEVAEEEFGQHANRWRLERFPSRFRRLLQRSVRDEVISVATAASLTGLTIDEIEELVVSHTSGGGPSNEQRTELDEFAASGVIGE